MACSSRDHVKDYQRDKKLMAALDARTEIPHLLIELRSLGAIEICGKDMGGIFKRLESWMADVWGCEYAFTELKRVPDMSAFTGNDFSWGLRYEGFKNVEDTLKDHDRLCDASFAWKSTTKTCCMPMCSKAYTITAFKQRGEHGENNMGKLSMQLVNFMTNTCGWSLKLLNGTNLGFYGQIREQQLKFKAPHPLNLIAPHLMIELRHAGYIEINGPNTNGIIEKLGQWLASTWGARNVKADPKYCDVKFSCDAFQKRGDEGENNMGMRTMQIVDFMVGTSAWSMVTCNGGNYGRYGDIREQQLVFRYDEHAQQGQEHIMIELRDVGYIEVNGLRTSPSIEAHLDRFFQEGWQCTEYVPGSADRDKYCDRKYVTPDGFYYKHGLTNNIGKLTMEVAMVLASEGWMLALCNGGHTSSLKSPSSTNVHTPFGGAVLTEVVGHMRREQQIKFTKVPPGGMADGSLLMIELRAVPGDPPTITQPVGHKMAINVQKQISNENATKLRNWIVDGEYQGIIEVSGLNINGVYQKLETFIKKYMRGTAQGATSYCDCLFTCSVFRQKLAPQCNEFWDGYYCGENNLGKYTMRLCDFLVDHLGEWDLVVCNGNAAERAWQFGGLTSLVAREQQMVFRHRAGARAVFMASSMPEAPLGKPPVDAPAYWKDATRDGSSPHEVIPATSEELQWLQQLLDGTHINKVTRDRKGGALADRFKVVSAVRSEHPALWDAFAKRRKLVEEHIASNADAEVCELWAQGICEDGAACKRRHFDASSLVTPKTVAACTDLAEHCALPDGSNNSNAAFLMHGTNPTSAVGILRTDFHIDLAGASAGTMFGPGVYLAEASSKADEYAQADKDGAHKGLLAILVCRAVVGRSYVVQKPGDYSKQVTSRNFDTIVGDRERAVGTFREFIFFHAESIYPEYAVFYRREFSRVPDPAKSDPIRANPSDMFVKPIVPVKALPGRTPQEYQVLVPVACRVGSMFQVELPGKVTEVEVPRYMRPGGIMTLILSKDGDVKPVEVGTSIASI